MKNTNHLPVELLCTRLGISERRLSVTSGLSRSCIRGIKDGGRNVTVNSLRALAHRLERGVLVLMTPRNTEVSLSTVEVSLLTVRDGFESWKIHFMNLVDAFRASLDPRLVLLPPVKELDPRLRALLASMVSFLCDESSVSAPSWAERSYFLPEPWFPSGVESLKASALVESPPAFRSNNIFVLGNFLSRA